MESEGKFSPGEAKLQTPKPPLGCQAVSLSSHSLPLVD